jgi:hypothetical protein
VETVPTYPSPTMLIFILVLDLNVSVDGGWAMK